jgi:hypothetical protein
VPAELLHGAFRFSPGFFGRFPQSGGVGFGRIRRFNLRAECGGVRLLQPPVFGEQAVAFNASHDRRSANARPNEACNAFNVLASIDLAGGGL